jgi:hypothetical protein
MRDDDARVTSPRHFLLDVQVSDGQIAGSVTNDAGSVRSFEGWLGLIAALESPVVGERGEVTSPDAHDER